VKAFQDVTAAVDSSGLCLFSTFAWSLEDIQPQIDAACEGDWSLARLMEIGERIWNLELDAACEGDWSLARLMEIGERIWNLERQFNLAAGIDGKEDWLPKRLVTEPAKTGPAKGLVNRLDKMLPEYYQLRGWSPEGVPSRETLDRLGL